MSVWLVSVTVHCQGEAGAESALRRHFRRGLQDAGPLRRGRAGGLPCRQVMML